MMLMVEAAGGGHIVIDRQRWRHFGRFSRVLARPIVVRLICRRTRTLGTQTQCVIGYRHRLGGDGRFASGPFGQLSPATSLVWPAGRPAAATTTPVLRLLSDHGALTIIAIQSVLPNYVVRLCYKRLTHSNRLDGIAQRRDHIYDVVAHAHTHS